MMRRIAGFGVCIAIASLITAGGCSKGDNKDGGGGGGGGATYKTPDEAFAAMKSSIKNKDWPTAMGTMTTETQDMVAGGMAFAGMMMKQFAKFGKADDAKIAKLEKVLTKHGLTEDHFKTIKMDPKEAKENPNAMLAKMTAPIKNKPAFVGEIIEAMGDQKGMEMKEIGDATLTDVKITGDNAKGTVVSTKNGAEKRDPIDFRKQNGSWRIDMTRMMKKEVGPRPGN